MSNQLDQEESWVGVGVRTQRKGTVSACHGLEICCGCGAASIPLAPLPYESPERRSQTCQDL